MENQFYITYWEKEYRNTDGNFERVENSDLQSPTPIVREIV